MGSFESLGLAEPLSTALASFGFEGPTPIQSLAIPLLLARHDAFIESETGTGKTLAYLAPAIQAVFSGMSEKRRGSGEPAILVAAPTQELAVQIGREADKLAKAASLPLKTAVVLGGTPLDKQVAKLRERPDLVVGTLGRLGDLLSLGKLKLGALVFLVLDEADRLLAPETADSAKALVSSSPEGCARVLVSATIPERYRAEMRPLLRAPAEPQVKGETVLSGSIEHWCFYCDSRKRLDFVRRFEAALRPERCLLFLSVASRVEGAAERLASFGLPVAAIYSGLEKEERRVAIERFASGEVRYLLTSDLGARGLDIPAVSHVISLDLPDEPTIYTHRAGRTGRAGAKGISIVLADGVELSRASKIAVRGKFVFRCKFLESGTVFEPTPAEFFARAEAAEEDRLAARVAREGDAERRRPPRPRQSPPGRREAFPDRSSSPAPRPRTDEARNEKGFYLRKKPATPRESVDRPALPIASGDTARRPRRGPADRGQRPFSRDGREDSRESRTRNEMPRRQAYRDAEPSRRGPSRRPGSVEGSPRRPGSGRGAPFGKGRSSGKPRGS
jgi:ATP-dependent RNA helicase DeaD